jgi:class 3 adenylate cyclase
VFALSVRALLFTDIEGSTAILRRLGDRYERALARHHAIIASAVAASSGVTESTQGDSQFATFPSATAAIEGALETQRQIESEPWPPGGRIRVRMGVHIGEVAASGTGPVGLAIHQAARIMNAAHGGQIVASAELLEQASRLPAGITARSLGLHDLRDIGQVELYQVEHPDPATRLSSAPDEACGSAQPSSPAHLARRPRDRGEGRVRAAPWASAGDAAR